MRSYRLPQVGSVVDSGTHTGFGKERGCVREALKVHSRNGRLCAILLLCHYCWRKKIVRSSSGHPSPPASFIIMIVEQVHRGSKSRHRLRAAWSQRAFLLLGLFLLVLFFFPSRVVLFPSRVVLLAFSCSSFPFSCFLLPFFSSSLISSSLLFSSLTPVSPLVAAVVWCCCPFTPLISCVRARAIA